MIKKLMTAAALLTMVGTASSATLYTTGVLDFNKTTKGSYLGKIGAAVPATVLKKQGSLSYVRISGWTLAEYPSMIFAEPDAAEYFGKNCEWIAPKPGTDVAMMIAMAHELESSGKVDREFIRKYTVGYDKFIAYVLGKTDGVAKTPAWAEKICGVKADAIKRLAHLMREKRSMLMGGWGIQRAQHGEQVHWMMVVLAAMCGHIGQPGGGFGFSYHYSNGGAATSMAPALGGISANPKGGSEGLSWVGESLAIIPLARFTDCFLNPGKTIDYNGKKITYPDIRLVFWSGGNPFAQQEDTNGLIKAWKRPETTIVCDTVWTASARFADIVLPACTSLERVDITSIGSYSNLGYVAMQQAIEPQYESHSDFWIYRELSKKMGFEKEFTEGLDEMGWIRRFYENAAKEARVNGLEMPSFEEFWARGYVLFPVDQDARRYNYLGDFRRQSARYRIGQDRNLLQEDRKLQVRRLPGTPDLDGTHGMARRQDGRRVSVCIIDEQEPLSFAFATRQYRFEPVCERRRSRTGVDSSGCRQEARPEVG